MSQANQNPPGSKRWQSATECWRQAGVIRDEAQAHRDRARRADWASRQNDAKSIASSFLGVSSGRYLAGGITAARNADKARAEAGDCARKAWALQGKALVHGTIALVQTICRYPS